jgi:hypothetical protein
MRAKKRSLAETVAGLESALDADAVGRERDWAERLGRALGLLAQAVRRHAAELDSEGGLYIDSARSHCRTMDRQVTQLHTDLVAALQRACVLRAEMAEARASGPPGRAFLDAQAFRRRGRELLSALRRYEEDEARLILECATTDIGGCG